VIDKINAILPQTQCGQCGFKGCRPYAAAIAAGIADINQCPPGGDEVILDLAKLTGVTPKPLNMAFGISKPKSIAFIIEESCIGCKKCIDVCPVDAIVGATKLMHTVISDECTGCELCISPCPVDCIILKPHSDWDLLDKAMKKAKSDQAKRRYEHRNFRRERQVREQIERLQQKKADLLTTGKQ
jgi:electron transport complex protein RnfB